MEESEILPRSLSTKVLDFRCFRVSKVERIFKAKRSDKSL